MYYYNIFVLMLIIDNLAVRLYKNYAYPFIISIIISSWRQPFGGDGYEWM